MNLTEDIKTISSRGIMDKLLKPETVTIKVKSANPWVNDPETITITQKQFTKLKRYMFINTVWNVNQIWLVGPRHNFIRVLEINDESVVDKTIEELNSKIPDLPVKAVSVCFKSGIKWK